MLEPPEIEGGERGSGLTEELGLQTDRPLPVERRSGEGATGGRLGTDKSIKTRSWRGGWTTPRSKRSEIPKISESRESYESSQYRFMTNLSKCQS